MNFWINALLLFLAICVFIIGILLIFKKNIQITADIPSDAIPVMGKNFVYMWIWKNEGKIKFVFSNHPHVVISFDEKIKNELVDALKKIN